jgi:hypothetical protein
MTWHKMDTKWQGSPRLAAIEREHGRQAAKDAALAFAAVLGVNTEHACHGKLEQIYTDPEWMRLAGHASRLTVEELEVALRHLITAGLLHRDGALLCVSGWDPKKWDTVLPSTERVRLHREIKALGDAKRTTRQRGAV